MVFRYLHRPHRSREIASRTHPIPQLVEVIRLRHREPFDADRVHTRRPTVGPDLLPRPIDEAFVDLKRLHLRLRSHPRLLPRGIAAATAPGTATTTAATTTRSKPAGTTGAAPNATSAPTPSTRSCSTRSAPPCCAPTCSSPANRRSPCAPPPPTTNCSPPNWPV